MSPARLSSSRMGIPPDQYLAPPTRGRLSPTRIRLGLARRVRRILFPREPKIRRVPFGVARGLRLDINLRIHMNGMLGLYEIELARYVRELCPRGSNAIDVGAHSGYYTLATRLLRQR